MSREYYTFTWGFLFNVLESAKQQKVQFKAYPPKDDGSYQFCYVDQDGVVQGASIPFQFFPERKRDFMALTTKGKTEGIQWHEELC